jgi:hypothetical protein
MNQTNDDYHQILEELKGQQEKINTLATSLQQMLLFFQDQGSKGESNSANLFAVSQQSIQYLNALLNNTELVKQQTDMIRPGLMLIQDTLKKTEGDQEDQLDVINKSLISLKQEQVKAHKVIVSVQKTALSHGSKSNKWYSNVGGRSVILISTLALLASGINFAVMTTKIDEVHSSLHREISILQKQLRSRQSK